MTKMMKLIGKDFKSLYTYAQTFIGKYDHNDKSNWRYKKKKKELNRT